MSITAQQKIEIVEKHKRGDKDSGSAEVQIALLTQRITSLTKHMQANPKDFISKLGLLKMVSRRRRHLKYLKGKFPGRYQDIIKELQLRR